MGFLALAIILLAAVSGLGRLQAHLPFTIPLLGTLNLIGFAGSGYALLLYRNSLIPLPRRWHAVAISSLAAASVFLIAAQALSAGKTASTIVAIVWVLIWCACVGEPIVRFWLVARNLPAVQAWRLRSLSLGFGGLVAVLLFAISIGLLVKQPVVQVAFEVVVLAIVPLLYASFAPPTGLRRQWRAPEEEGLRAFMEELLLNEDRDALAARALEWATRLVGGAAAVQFDANRKPTAFRGLDARQIDELAARVSRLDRGVSRITLSGEETSVIALPVAGLSGSGTLVVVAGPFTPGFGGDEMNRTQQLMSAFVTALDRRHLMAQLEQRNVALQEANRHKSVFLANMSHELRTPLNAIIGFSELLTDAREGQFDDATRKRFLSQILTSGKHLLGLINDILDLSKVEAGQMELRLSLVSVAEAVDQVSKTVEPLVAKKNITLLAKVDGAGEVLADGGKLKQMLLNLVSNAIKFTPEDGTVTIDATSRIDVSSEGYLPGYTMGNTKTGGVTLAEAFCCELPVRPRTWTQARGHGSRARPDEAVRPSPRRRRARDQPDRQGQRLHARHADPRKGAASERACEGRGGERARFWATGAGGGRRPGGCGAAHAPARERRLSDRGGAIRE